MLRIIAGTYGINIRRKWKSRMVVKLRLHHCWLLLHLQSNFSLIYSFLLFVLYCTSSDFDDNVFNLCFLVTIFLCSCCIWIDSFWVNSMPRILFSLIFFLFYLQYSSSIAIIFFGEIKSSSFSESYVCKISPICKSLISTLSLNKNLPQKFCSLFYKISKVKYFTFFSLVFNNFKRC